VNPFALPGKNGDHRQPLCPWSVAEHANYYVDVDHLGTSYEKFQQDFADPTGPLAEGRTIVAIGREGCGKTSLVNRCAYWLKDHLGDGVDGRIVDLRTTGKSSESVEERMNSAAKRMVRHLTVRRMVSESAAKMLAECGGDPEDVYPLISEILPEKMALILLLPPLTDASGELVDYARFTGRGIFFFTESVYGNVIESQLTTIWHESAVQPIVLKVGLLSEKDGETFRTARLGDEVPGEFPLMADDDILKITRMRPSIRYLQNILYQVYEERRQAGDRYERRYSVTYYEVIDSYFKRATEAGGTGN
jgi:energy-coupling factor transporter ATP-binding protein EcfA2